MKSKKSLEKKTTEEIPGDAVLVLKSVPWEKFKEESLVGMEEFGEGDGGNKVIRNFEDPTEIQRILTPKRLEIIESIMTDQPRSMTELSNRLDRGMREIHEDLHLLEKYDVVKLERHGKAKKPVIPYTKIEIDIELGP